MYVSGVRRRDVVIDALVAVVAFAVSVAVLRDSDLDVPDVRDTDLFAYALLATYSASIVIRRKWALPAVAIGLAAGLAYAAASYAPADARGADVDLHGRRRAAHSIVSSGARRFTAGGLDRRNRESRRDRSRCAGVDRGGMVARQVRWVATGLHGGVGDKERGSSSRRDSSWRTVLSRRSD